MNQQPLITGSVCAAILPSSRRRYRLLPEPLKNRQSSVHDLFHSESQILAFPPTPPITPTLPIHSVMPLAYSIGMPPPRSGMLHVPVFICAFLNKRPPSPAPTRNSSFAAAIALYCLSSSSSRFFLIVARWRFQARCMVQCRSARLREKRRGRGVSVVGWWRW